MSNPLLSVCLITYRHEAYIRQAIEGVLMQKVDFSWEFIIAEDCSPDGTRPIVEEYKAKHPDLIKLILQERNVGPAQNFLDLMSAARGKYIAYIEGDDYWTSPVKLQKQVDVLESHPETVICFHNMKLKDESKAEHPLYTTSGGKPSQISGLRQLVQRNYIPSASACFVNPHMTAFPPWHLRVFCGDWPLFVDIAFAGCVYYIDEIMGVYRIHSAGAFSGLNNLKKLTGTLRVQLEIVRRLLANLRLTVLPFAGKAIARSLFDIARVWTRERLKAVGLK